MEPLIATKHKKLKVREEGSAVKTSSKEKSVDDFGYGGGEDLLRRKGEKEELKVAGDVSGILKKGLGIFKEGGGTVGIQKGCLST